MKIFSDPANSIHQLLSSKYSGMNLGELKDQVKFIEIDIQDFILSGIVEYFSRFRSFKLLGSHEFHFNGSIFMISIQCCSKKPRLEICLLNVKERAINLHSAGVKDINGAGYFSEFECEVSNALKSHSEPISEAVQKIYTAAYAWMETEMFRLIREVEKGFVGALYQYLHVILRSEGKPELGKDVWFSVFSEKSGFYALDGKTIDGILTTLKERRYMSPHSPAVHLLGLIGLEMPSQKSLSMNAITKGKYSEYSLQKAAYISDMSDIFKTEEQMTKGGAYAIFPLGGVGDQQIVAAFPSSLRCVLEPIFEKNKHNFKKVYEKEAGSLKRHLANIRASYRRVDSGGYAGMVGNFLGAFLKQYF